MGLPAWAGGHGGWVSLPPPRATGKGGSTRERPWGEGAVGWGAPTSGRGSHVGGSGAPTPLPALPLPATPSPYRHRRRAPRGVATISPSPSSPAHRRGVASAGPTYPANQERPRPFSPYSPPQQRSYWPLLTGKNVHQPEEEIPLTGRGNCRCRFRNERRSGVGGVPVPGGGGGGNHGAAPPGAAVRPFLVRGG